MKRAKIKSLLKKTYFALSIFVIGALQLLTARRIAKSSLELALVRNEFLDKPPTSIVVVGEINSWHKYASNVLRNAFGDMTRLHDQIFRHDMLNHTELNDISMRTDILWVMVVRSPCDAADEVIRFQKEACQNNELPSGQCKPHEFASESDYYRMPWYDLLGDGFDASDENIIESKPRQNYKYDDIFDMRRQKLLLMKQIMDAVPRHAKILRLGEFELNPDVFVNDLVKEYSFKLRKEYKLIPPGTNPQNMFVNPSNIFSCMEYAKWKEAQQRIDWTLEGYFGYNRLDCHLCRDSGQVGNNGFPISPPSNIYILGERNSGTTFVSNTLAEAFHPPNTMGSDLEKFSSDVPVLLHKHMFRHDLLNSEELAEIKARDDILWVMVVRTTCDWAEAMFRKPYHLCPPKHPEKCGPGSDPNSKVWLNQNSVAGVSLLQFWTEMEWNDWAESVPFLRNKVDTNRETDEMPISKVSANYTYPNIFGLRRHKLKIMKQIIETVPRNVKFVRLKELERSPELFIQSLVKEFNLTLKEGYESQPPSKVAHQTVCLTPAEWDAAQKAVDWSIEAEFGFSPCDCRLCYGYDKSKRLYDRVVEGRKINKITNMHGRGKAEKERKAERYMKEVGKVTKGPTPEEKKVDRSKNQKGNKKPHRRGKMQKEKSADRIKKVRRE
mmetsp:Transcript_47602/g.101156  ORF Transcript_47602/g.101156 Transcript_47602/m.101156 type:complete len:666 (-) Transcript_47602:73-2070(-)|eukprot:CAMPEP_0172538884 /NCGR_PEP_ID=MMETSP1067-20121228/10183_1 /TAXON_ID=265564 ORGANISM="Thalassiosira punctigera, Strain Tpunct2005C2" /NCGR_SAMPLE_ID=MMETSP1067 /ASSEMBLY_ACC=CAM_ASM_000444 /LENGTH=665 /DNA_ID=CAMNT_0013324475 /DNA_START=140 /DNA_END=2137 /DNA_ORIENTATION=+